MAAPVNAASRLVSTLSGGAAGQSPVEALLNIQLDAELTGILSPALEKLGFSIETQEIPDRFGDSRRTVSLARGQTQTFYMVLIPSWVLEHDLDNNLAAFDYLSYTFANSRAYILARDLDAMGMGFSLMKDEWSKRNIKAEFIPWRYVKTISTAKKLDLQLHLVAQTFKLPGSPFDRPNLTRPMPSSSETSDGTPMNRKINPDHIDMIVSILTARASSGLEGTPQEFFQDLVTSSHLPQEWTQSIAGRWSGNAPRD